MKVVQAPGRIIFELVISTSRGLVPVSVAQLQKPNGPRAVSHQDNMNGDDDRDSNTSTTPIGLILLRDVFKSEKEESSSTDYVQVSNSV